MAARRAAMEAERGMPPRTRPSPPNPALLALPRLRMPELRRPACVLSSVLDVPARRHAALRPVSYMR